MIIKWKPFIINVLIPLLLGGVSSLLTMGSMDIYKEITRPPLSPPGWLFPIVWTVLFILIGISSYIIWQSESNSKTKTKAYIIYALDLLVNFIWTLVFFNLRAYNLSVLIIVVLLILIFLNIYFFTNINKTAALLLVPYLIWVSFATYLNIGIAMLN